MSKLAGAYKSANACLLAWAMTVMLIGCRMPSSTLEAMRRVKNDVISHSRAWGFLKSLFELIVLSYPVWWLCLPLGAQRESERPRDLCQKSCFATRFLSTRSTC